MTDEGVVMTVLGEVESSELGPTLMHEHVVSDFSYYASPAGNFDDVPLTMENLGRLRRNPGLAAANFQLVDLELAVREVTEFRDEGGDTIVDVTLADIGRDASALATVSERTGVRIVAGCGYYVFPTHPPTLASASETEVAEVLVDEIVNGIGASRIRPGIIGEIGTSEPVHPTEEKVLRAAVRAQAATGLALSIHLHPPARNGHTVLDILERAGAELDRVILGHVDLSLGHMDVDFAELVDYHRSLLARGAFIAYDTIGNELYWPDLRGKPMSFPSDRERARALAMLIERGHAEQIIISQDIALKLQLQSYGGYGYASVLRDFPVLLDLVGVDEKVLTTLTVENPRKLLSVRRLSAAPTA
jgi:phosphotriesterase-related protein